MCDASAAYVSPAGELWVADDESQRPFVYPPGKGAAPLRRIDLGLGKSEADFEGVAALGDTVWWIAGHGRNKDAEPRPSRQVLLATSHTGAVLGRTDRLLPALLAAPDIGPILTSAEPNAPKKGGIAIEGLAAGDGALWLGFRSPLDAQGRALVVRLDAPDALRSGGQPALGPVEHLDLGGQGIRSLERAGSTWWIVGGDPGSGGTSTLWRWAGPGTAPAAVPVDLAGFNPEGLVVLADGRLQLLSDDGTREVGGKECKDAAEDQRSFRARTIAP